MKSKVTIETFLFFQVDPPPRPLDRAFLFPLFSLRMQHLHQQRLSGCISAQMLEVQVFLSPHRQQPELGHLAHQMIKLVLHGGGDRVCVQVCVGEAESVCQGFGVEDREEVLMIKYLLIISIPPLLSRRVSE